MKKHEAYIRARDETADVGIGGGVVIDDFEPHIWLQPLYFFDNIEGSMDDELVHVS